MSRYVKAVAALLTALGTWGATAAADGRYDQIELWALTGVLVTGLAVFALPNTPPPGKPADPNVSETDPASSAPPAPDPVSSTPTDDATNIPTVEVESSSGIPVEAPKATTRRRRSGAQRAI